MKKLIIALGVVAMVACTQAATIKWTSQIKLPTDPTADTPNLAQGGSNVTKTTANVHLYLYSLTSAITANDGDVWKTYTTYNSDTKSYTLNTTGATDATGALDSSSISWKSSLATITGSTSSYSVDDTAYAAIIVWNDVNADGKINDGDVYLATQGSYTLTSDSGKSVALLTTSTGAWTAVPEPTSGILLLLGMAGLALKRKIA